MKLRIAASFVLLFSFACGEVAPSGGAESASPGTDSPAQERQGDATPRNEAPVPVRSEFCAQAFSSTVVNCDQHGTSTNVGAEDPAGALPADFPAAPRELTYCDGGHDAVGTAGLRWAMAGAPDEVQEFYLAALAAQGYHRTPVERASFAPCAEAISFGKEGVGSGYIGFALSQSDVASSTVVSVTFAAAE